MKLNVAQICCLSAAMASLGIQARAEDDSTEAKLPESFVRQAGQLEEAVSFFREDRERMKQELDRLRKELQAARDEASRRLDEPDMEPLPTPVADDTIEKERDLLKTRCELQQSKLEEQLARIEALKKENLSLQETEKPTVDQAGIQQKLKQVEKERDQLTHLLEDSQQAGRQLDADAIRLAKERDSLRKELEQVSKTSTQQLTELAARAQKENASLRDKLEEEHLSRTTADDSLRKLAAELSGERGRSTDLARKLSKTQQKLEQFEQLSASLGEEKEHLLAQVKERPQSEVAVAPAPVEAKPTMSPHDVTAQAAKARRLLADGQAMEARDLYLACIEAQPDNTMARLGLANCYYQLGDLTRAEKEATALARMGNQPYACGLLGLIMMQQGRCDEASKTMREAVKMEPRCPRLRNYYGVALQNDQRPNEAIGQFRQALRLDDNFGEAHYNLAVLLATTPPENLEEARKHYQLALKLGRPKNEELETIFSL